jgi:arginine decarboxylase
MKLSVDVSALGITGYQAKDRFESDQRLTVQLGDARRSFLPTPALTRLGDAFEALAAEPPTDERPAPHVPQLEQLNLEQGMSPRDAFFAATEQAADPAGRIAAEMISPYPPGVHAVLPGERLTPPVVDYLRAGRAAGMTIPDAADPTLDTFRVVRQ